MTDLNCRNVTPSFWPAMTTFQSSHRDVNGQPFSMPPISPPKTNVVVKSEAKEGESEDVHDGLHRGMKPRQLSAWSPLLSALGS